MMQPEGDLPETHFYTDFTMAGQDAFAMVAFLMYFMERMQIQSTELADLSISCAKGHDLYCRRCRYQSMFTRSLFD